MSCATFMVTSSLMRARSRLRLLDAGDRIFFATAAGVFGTAMVSSPALSSAFTCALSTWSGSVKVRGKLPHERSYA